MDKLRYNLNSNHPLIPNENNYFCEKKYVSINSEDRDIIKYPNPAFFEIELPQDYLNVQTVKLSSWSFPANYNVFSFGLNNVSMYFRMNNVFNPAAHGIKNELLQIIYKILSEDYNFDYIFVIEEGFYNPDQMARELTNKMNLAVTNRIKKYFSLHPEYVEQEKLFKEYNQL